VFEELVANVLERNLDLATQGPLRLGVPEFGEPPDDQRRAVEASVLERRDRRAGPGRRAEKLEPALDDPFPAPREDELGNLTRI
jgi:hypothetical protein